MFNYIQNTLFFSSLAVGDHLAINASYCGFKHFHHGILTSTDPLTVVDFSGESMSNVRVRAMSLLTFMNHQTSLFRVNHTKRLSGEETAQKATELVHSDTFGKYNLLSNNCNHFAIYCVTGKRYSEQISSLVDSSLGKLLQDFCHPVIS